MPQHSRIVELLTDAQYAKLPRGRLLACGITAAAPRQHRGITAAVPLTGATCCEHSTVRACFYKHNTREAHTVQHAPQHAAYSWPTASVSASSQRGTPAHGCIVRRTTMGRHSSEFCDCAGASTFLPVDYTRNHRGCFDHGYSEYSEYSTRAHNDRSTRSIVCTRI
jgi:hypothetical protein